MTTKRSVHTAQRAAWRCQGCRRELCPDCATDKLVRGGNKALMCVHCGGFAETIMVTREVRPYWTVWPRFFESMFRTRDGLIQLVAVGVALYVADLAPGALGVLLKTFVFVSYYFQVIRRAAKGGETLPLPADFTGYDNYFVVVGYGIVSMLIWVPALVYMLIGVDWFELQLNPGLVLLQQAANPTVIALLIAGTLYYPAATVAGAVADSALVMLNPILVARMILRIPGQYIGAMFAWLVLAALNGLWGLWLQFVFQLLYFPIVSSLIVVIGQLPLSLLTGFILGRLIFQNHEHFGLVPETPLSIPEWPDAYPRGEPRRRQVYAAAEGLVAAIDQRNEAAALRAFDGLRSDGAPLPEMDAEMKMRLVSFLETNGRYVDAITLCNQVAQSDLQSESASNAIFEAGRIIVERLNDVARGKAVFEHLVSNYPNHGAAEAAKARLQRL